MSLPNIGRSTSSASNASDGDDQHDGLPRDGILGPGQILLQPSHHIEPVYRRCSKDECNPDGVQGWLTKIGDVNSSTGLRLVDSVRHPGYTVTRIADHYRTRLAFTKLGQDYSPQWHEIHAPHGGDADHRLPSAEKTLVIPRTPYTKEPCNCSQNHTSILYNHARIPLGLLGGLCFNTERLRPHLWSCCIHYDRSDPMPLS